MKILVCNRSECAMRIVRAAKQLGFSTVGMYALGDKEQLHLRDVDETVCIGDSNATDSYLHIHHILTAARITACTSVHPGYGFLSESHTFARAVEEAGLQWIGPPSHSMALLSNKSAGRIIAQRCGLHVVQGSLPMQELEEMRSFADHIGYPVLLKATHGGGGKGLRIITHRAAWDNAYLQCLKETQRSTNTDIFIVESYLQQPKHIEVQILVDCDQVIHILGFRDCSIQFRHQKIIEESFFPEKHNIDTSTLIENIRRMLQEIHYQGLGTMEFLYAHHTWYFIEMNMRMQVEHAVTECQTGHDLIVAQIRTAHNMPSTLLGTAAHHAIECRINLRSFAHGAHLHTLRLPGGCNVRVDTALYAGYTIPHHYDAMLAKIICYDHDRSAALRRMHIALSETQLHGIDSNIPELQEILSCAAFTEGSHHTQLLSRNT